MAAQIFAASRPLMPIKKPKTDVRESHRVRVAREKRARMRATLLSSVVDVLSAADRNKTPVIDDVVKHAGVSRGTFYKYFDSLELAVQEVTTSLADEMADTVTVFCRDETEPAMPLALAFQLFLLRARHDRVWGGIVAHLGLLSVQPPGMAKGIRTDLERGRKSGHFKLRSVDFAVDMIVGTLGEAVFRIVTGQCKPAYIPTMAEMVLRALGVSLNDAADVVQRAHDRLMVEGPRTMAWWNQEAAC